MSSPDPTDDPTLLGAAELAAAIRRGDLSAATATEAHIARISEVDSQLNAVVIPLFDEARSAAAAADEALRGREEVGPLHGVPVTVKEQFMVAGTQTTLGATRRIGNVNRGEGPLVAALRDAGAVVLGKTNVMQTLAGWESDNPVYGRTNNPWDLGRTPGGSSGGEAAIIAAGGSALGLGGDLGGSIRLPAHFCGVHGFKPTTGRLTNTDFAPGLLGTGQEVVVPQPGPLARSVDDLALAMAVFAETSLAPTLDVVPPVPWIDPSTVDVRNLRVGMVTDNDYFALAPSVRRAVEDAGTALAAAGIDVVPVDLPPASEGVRIFLGAMSGDGGADLLALLDGEKPIPQLEGLVRGARLPGPARPVVARLMARRGQHHVARQIPQMGRCSAEELESLAEARSDYRAAFTGALDRAGVDAVICPPVATPAFTHGSSGDLVPAVSYAFVFNVLGVPAGVVAATRVRPDEETERTATEDETDIAARTVEENSAGLPVGVQVVARHWHDHTVLAVMGALESHFRATEDYPGRGSVPI